MVDQRFNGDEWFSLGTFFSVSQVSTSIEGVDGSVSVDATKLVCGTALTETTILRAEDEVDDRRVTVIGTWAR